MTQWAGDRDRGDRAWDRDRVKKEGEREREREREREWDAEWEDISLIYHFYYGAKTHLSLNYDHFGKI